MGIAHTDTLLVAALMRGPPASFAAGSSSIAEPGRIAADPFADRRRVLADARGEDERIDALRRGRKRAELAPDAGT